MEHFTILGDNLTYRLVRDALDPAGPADLRRVPAGTCQTVTTPGVSPDALRAGVGAVTGAARQVPTTAVFSEPALAGYAAAG
ncbi:MAG: hypothetical protein ACR2FE_09720 [Aeromicrobium sp.]